MLMDQPTVDPSTVIEARGSGWVLYRTDQGERWVIRGTCVACGSCEVGAATPSLVWTGRPVGQPGACVDKTYGFRLDVPVRPEISELAGCTLSGEYL